jgi:hypothetical protein
MSWGKRTPRPADVATWQTPTAEQYESQLRMYREAQSELEHELADTRRVLWWALREHEGHHVRISEQAMVEADHDAVFARFENKVEGWIDVYAMTSDEATGAGGHLADPQ